MGRLRTTWIIMMPSLKLDWTKTLKVATRACTCAFMCVHMHAHMSGCQKRHSEAQRVCHHTSKLACLFQRRKSATAERPSSHNRLCTKSVLTAHWEQLCQAIPVLAYISPYGSRRLRLPGLSDNRYIKLVRLSALCTGHLYPPGKIPGTHFS
jgi:hypothetical protein